MEFKRRSKLKTTPNLQVLNGGKEVPPTPPHTEQPLLEAQRVEGGENLHEMAKETSKNWGFPRHRWRGNSATASALKSSLRSPQACSPCLAAKSTEPYHDPAKGRVVAGNTPFPLSWGQGDLFPCGVWGSAPRALGENKR